MRTGTGQLGTLAPIHHKHTRQHNGNVISREKTRLQDRARRMAKTTDNIKGETSLLDRTRERGVGDGDSSVASQNSLVYVV